MKYRLIQSVVTLGARLPSSQNALCDSGRSNGLTFSRYKRVKDCDLAQNTKTKIEIKSVRWTGSLTLEGTRAVSRKARCEAKAWGQRQTTVNRWGWRNWVFAFWHEWKHVEVLSQYLSLQLPLRLFFLNEWTLSALDYTFNHTSIRLFYTLYSHLPHSQQLFNLNPGVWLWTARTSVRLPALATTWTHLHYSVRIHPKNSLAIEFPAFCHGVQSAPNKKSPLNKTGKKWFSCINNNNNNNNHNNDKKKKWKRIQMDSLRLEEQFRNCNCGVDDVTHEKLNK